MLKDRLQEVENRIDRACAKAGRKRQEITLVAVTKVFPATIIREAFEVGLRDFGENYVQEFAQKRPELGELPGATFHLIGHLQSNKTKVAADLFDVVQTVDTAKLGRRLSDSSTDLKAMIEVKLSPEEAKAGAAPEELPELIEALRSLPGLPLLGLMTVPPWSEDAELSRPYFQRLCKLAQQHGLADLSMGMSHDLEVAIEEGATYVRVGTALFGRRVRQ